MSLRAGYCQVKHSRDTVSLFLSKSQVVVVKTVGRFNRRQKPGGGERDNGQSAGGLQSPVYGVYKEQRGIFNGLAI